MQAYTHHVCLAARRVENFRPPFEIHVRAPHGVCPYNLGPRAVAFKDADIMGDLSFRAIFFFFNLLLNHFCQFIAHVLCLNLILSPFFFPPRERRAVYVRHRVSK